MLAIALNLCYNDVTKTLESVSQYPRYSHDLGRNQALFEGRKQFACFPFDQRYGVPHFEGAGGDRRKGRGGDDRKNCRGYEGERKRSCLCVGCDFRSDFAL